MEKRIYLTSQENSFREQEKGFSYKSCHLRISKNLSKLIKRILFPLDRKSVFRSQNEKFVKNSKWKTVY